MTWHGIEGHDEVVEQFRRAVSRGRLASSFLFAGPEGVGKFTFAVKLAQALLCQTRPETALDPCGECPACRQVLAGTHPDVEVVAKPKDKSFIPLELFIGDKEHRGSEGLCRSISLKPYMGGRKVVIIDDADYLNPEGANALLKTLEEPPPRSVLILVGTSPAKQLPTIRSRCQLIRFRPLPSDVVAGLMISQGIVENPAEAQRLASHCEGSLRRAAELADPQLWAFRNTLLQRLAEETLDSVRLAKAVSVFVEEANSRRPGARGCDKSSTSPRSSTGRCSVSKPGRMARRTTMSAASSRRPCRTGRAQARYCLSGSSPATVLPNLIASWRIEKTSTQLIATSGFRSGG